MIIKVQILDTGATGYAYEPPRVDGLLNTEQIVSVKPYHGRSVGNCCLVTLTVGEPVVVCWSVSELWEEIEEKQQN